MKEHPSNTNRENISINSQNQTKYIIANKINNQYNVNIYNGKRNDNKNPINNKRNNNKSNKQNNIIKKKLNLNLNYKQNIYNYCILRKINFIERLKSISEERYSDFIKEFRKPNYFMDASDFKNLFVNEKNINIEFPLTQIFYSILNPTTLQEESGQNFLETIHKKRGDRDYSMKYDINELNQVPKYFNDTKYVKDLFTNINEEKLNKFLNEIKNWKKIFTFVQEFKYFLPEFLILKQISITDKATVYFISPFDLIMDYHSYGHDFPMAEIFESISQYRFHCDINFDIEKGSFSFKTSILILNTINILKPTLFPEICIVHSNNYNEKEIKENIWPKMKYILKINKDDSLKDKKNNIMENRYYKYKKIIINVLLFIFLLLFFNVVVKILKDNFSFRTIFYFIIALFVSYTLMFCK